PGAQGRRPALRAAWAGRGAQGAEADDQARGAPRGHARAERLRVGAEAAEGGVVSERERVQAFVNERYQGVYLTQLHSRESNGSYWVTWLHSPDGPQGWTLGRQDGTLADTTR